jgi:hypothetical protein
MTQLKPRSERPSWSQDKAQPRFLAPRERGHPCSWTSCPAEATNVYKDNTYCASHLFVTLQKQWQQEGD